MHSADLGPADSQQDEVAFALERLCTLLVWIDEHRASFEAAQASDPQTAAAELAYLEDATRQAHGHAKHLAQLLLAGRAIDCSKHLPRHLSEVVARLSPPQRS